MGKFACNLFPRSRGKNKKEPSQFYLDMSKYLDENSPVPVSRERKLALFLALNNAYSQKFDLKNPETGELEFSRFFELNENGEFKHPDFIEFFNSVCKIKGHDVVRFADDYVKLSSKMEGMVFENASTAMSYFNSQTRSYPLHKCKIIPIEEKDKKGNIVKTSKCRIELVPLSYEDTCSYYENYIKEHSSEFVSDPPKGYTFKVDLNSKLNPHNVIDILSAKIAMFTQRAEELKGMFPSDSNDYIVMSHVDAGSLVRSASGFAQVVEELSSDLKKLISEFKEITSSKESLAQFEQSSEFLDIVNKIAAQSSLLNQYSNFIQDCFNSFISAYEEGNFDDAGYAKEYYAQTYNYIKTKILPKVDTATNIEFSSRVRRDLARSTMKYFLYKADPNLDSMYIERIIDESIASNGKFWGNLSAIPNELLAGYYSTNPAISVISSIAESCQKIANNAYSKYNDQIEELRTDAKNKGIDEKMLFDENNWIISDADEHFAYMFKSFYSSFIIDNIDFVDQKFVQIIMSKLMKNDSRYPVGFLLNQFVYKTYDEPNPDAPDATYGQKLLGHEMSLRTANSNLFPHFKLKKNGVDIGSKLPDGITYNDIFIAIHGKSMFGFIDNVNENFPYFGNINDTLVAESKKRMEEAGLTVEVVPDYLQKKLNTADKVDFYKKYLNIKYSIDSNYNSTRQLMLPPQITYEQLDGLKLEDLFSPEVIKEFPKRSSWLSKAEAEQENQGDNIIPLSTDYFGRAYTEPVQYNRFRLPENRQRRLMKDIFGGLHVLAHNSCYSRALVDVFATLDSNMRYFSNISPYAQPQANSKDNDKRYGRQSITISGVEYSKSVDPFGNKAVKQMIEILDRITMRSNINPSKRNNKVQKARRRVYSFLSSLAVLPLNFSGSVHLLNILDPVFENLILRSGKDSRHRSRYKHNTIDRKVLRESYLEVMNPFTAFNGDSASFFSAGRHKGQTPTSKLEQLALLYGGDQTLTEKLHYIRSDSFHKRVLGNSLNLKGLELSDAFNSAVIMISHLKTQIVYVNGKEMSLYDCYEFKDGKLFLKDPENTFTISPVDLSAEKKKAVDNALFIMRNKIDGLDISDAAKKEIEQKVIANAEAKVEARFRVNSDYNTELANHITSSIHRTVGNNSSTSKGTLFNNPEVNFGSLFISWMICRVPIVQCLTSRYNALTGERSTALPKILKNTISSFFSEEKYREIIRDLGYSDVDFDTRYNKDAEKKALEVLSYGYLHKSKYYLTQALKKAPLVGKAVSRAARYRSSLTNEDIRNIQFFRNTTLLAAICYVYGGLVCSYIHHALIDALRRLVPEDEEEKNSDNFDIVELIDTCLRYMHVGIYNFLNDAMFVRGSAFYRLSNIVATFNHNQNKAIPGLKGIKSLVTNKYMSPYRDKLQYDSNFLGDNIISHNLNSKFDRDTKSAYYHDRDHVFDFDSYSVWENVVRMFLRTSLSNARDIFYSDHEFWEGFEKDSVDKSFEKLSHSSHDDLEAITAPFFNPFTGFVSTEEEYKKQQAKERRSQRIRGRIR